MKQIEDQPIHQHSLLSGKRHCFGFLSRPKNSCWSLFVLATMIAFGGCRSEKENSQAAKTDGNDKYLLKRVVSQESANKIEAFCGDCHKMPVAANFPIDGWKHEVERGFGFYTLSGRSDLVRPNVYDTIAYFTQKAPTREQFIEGVKGIPSRQKMGARFEEVDYKPTSQSSSISNVEYLPNKKGFVSTAMFDGKVYFQQLDDPVQAETILSVKAPINSTICDLDQDGNIDVLVSDIGEYKAVDAMQGKIVWLPMDKKEDVQSVELATGLGRICQTVVEDFDNDGDNDILVAEFGYVKTGSIFLLVNNGKTINSQAFTKVELDSRHGTVRIEAVDIDQDGDQDFVACIAQEFETVEIFINNGKGRFKSQSIFEADFPSYGSSGIEVVDLDLDGDQDVLFTNGDTFDSMVPKKYHSIQWLENDGKLHFTRHEMANMPGVHCARAADFDGDGDQDVVACAFMSNEEHNLEFEAIVYLENDGQMKFKKYWIEKKNLFYPNLKVGDFNSDGRMDFAVGTTDIGTVKQNSIPVRIFLNQPSK